MNEPDRRCRLNLRPLLPGVCPGHQCPIPLGGALALRGVPRACGPLQRLSPIPLPLIQLFPLPAFPQGCALLYLPEAEKD